jgi:hypothetical protein
METYGDIRDDYDGDGDQKGNGTARNWGKSGADKQNYYSLIIVTNYNLRSHTRLHTSFATPVVKMFLIKGGLLHPACLSSV